MVFAQAAPRQSKGGLDPRCCAAISCVAARAANLECGCNCKLRKMPWVAYLGGAGAFDACGGTGSWWRLARPGENMADWSKDPRWRLISQCELHGLAQFAVAQLFCNLNDHVPMIMSTVDPTCAVPIGVAAADRLFQCAGDELGSVEVMLAKVGLAATADGPARRRLDRIAVIIASLGRPVELGRWLDHAACQTLPPVELVWAVTRDEDMPAILPADTQLTIVRSRPGLTTQRNAGLDALTSSPDLIAFFDDDYVPTSTCLADIARAFEALPDVAGLSGRLLADGICGPGIEYHEARRLIDSHEERFVVAPPEIDFEVTEGLYGCNMVYRADRIQNARFDETLPLYGWQEDVDFANRVANGRPIGRTNGFAGVHQGAKGGRTSGRRLGYSQMVNPIYLYRKGSLSARKAFGLMARNFAANHAKSLRPEPWVDRRGRAAGNWLGIADMIRGKVNPQRATEL